MKKQISDENEMMNEISFSHGTMCAIKNWIR